MTKRFRRAILILSLSACLAPARGLADQIGDAALPLNMHEWVKGKPADFKSGTNVYVLVFCSMIRAGDYALGQLNDLQTRYRDKGVIVVAIADDPPGQLDEFMAVKGSTIQFEIASDDINRTKANYLRAYQQFMVPRAFIVGKNGDVLWHGHPLTDGMNEVVEEIVSGRYNLGQMRQIVGAREQMEQYVMAARQGEDKAAPLGRMLLSTRTNDAQGLCTLAFKIASDPYIENRDVALANAALDRAAALSPTNATRVAVNRAILLFQTGHQEEGLAQARKALDSAQGQSDRDLAQANLHAMEVRNSILKTNQSNALPPKP